MRSRLLVGIMLAVTVFCLAGCGVKDKSETKTKKVSGDSGRTLEERREAILKSFCEPGTILTKNCLYDSPIVLGEECIIQYRRDGKELSRVKLSGESPSSESICLWTGSDKRLIFSEHFEEVDGEGDALYSVPVKQTESGETVLWEQKETVASFACEEGACVFLYEPYLIYAEDDSTLVRMNLESREKKTMEFALADAEMFEFSLMDGLLYLVDRAPRTAPGDAVYRIRIDDWTSEKLYERKERGKEFIGELCVEGKYLMVALGNDDSDEDDEDYGGRFDTVSYDRIECYDMEQKKTVGQLSFDEIKAYLEKEMGDVGRFRSLKALSQSCMFFYEGRLYLSLDGVLGTEETDGKTYTHRQILFSCQQGQMTKFRYEREVSEWLYENCDSKKWNRKPPYEVEYYGEFLTAFGDEFYFTYMDKQEKTHLMGYHLDTKKMREVPKSDLVYQVFKTMGWLDEVFGL